MNTVPICRIHDMPIADYKMVEHWHFTPTGRVEGARTAVLSCGCEIIGADIRTVDLVTSEEAEAAGNDSWVVEIQIIDFTGEPVVRWQESLPVFRT